MALLDLLGDGMLPIVLGVTVILITVAIYFSLNSSSTAKPTTQVKTPAKTDEPKSQQAVVPKPKKDTKKEKEEIHPLKITNLKGHTGEITGVDVSSDGRYIATISTDRTLRITDARTLSEKTPKVIIVKLPLDHAIAVTFTADCRHILLSMANTQSIAVYKIFSKKNEEGKFYQEVHRFPTDNLHPNSITSLSWSTNSKFVVTCSEDTTYHVWTIKGKHLAAINTNQVKNNMATISPDSRFILVAAWTGDVRVWEVQYQKQSADVDKVVKAMDLTGHKSSVNWLNVSADSSKVATASKDGTWKLYNINVRFDIGQDPTCLLTVNSPIPGKGFQLIAISPNVKVVAATIDQSLYFYSIDGKLLESVDNVGEYPSHIVWSADSASIVVQGEKYVSLWRNPLQK